MSSFTDVPEWVPSSYRPRVQPLLEAEKWDEAARVLLEAFRDTQLEHQLEEFARHRTSENPLRVARNFMMSNISRTPYQYAYGAHLKQLLAEEVVEPVFTSEAFRYGRAKGNRNMSEEDIFVTSADAQSSNKSHEIAEDFNEEYPDGLEEDTPGTTDEYETHAEDPGYDDEDFRGAAMVATSEDAKTEKAGYKLYFAEEDEIPRGHDVYNYDGEHYVVLVDGQSEMRQLAREAAPRPVANNLDPVAWLEAERGSESRAIQIAEWLWENSSEDRFYDYMEDERRSARDAAKPVVEANFASISPEDREAAIRELTNYIEYNKPDNSPGTRFGRSEKSPDDMVTIRWPKSSLDPMTDWSHLEEAVEEFSRQNSSFGRLLERLWENESVEVEAEYLDPFADALRSFYRSSKDDVFVSDSGLKRWNAMDDFTSLISDVRSADEEAGFWDDYNNTGGHLNMSDNPVDVANKETASSRQSSGIQIRDAGMLEPLGQDIRSEFGSTMRFDGKIDELIRLRERIENGNLTPTEIERELREFRDTARQLLEMLRNEGADRGVIQHLQSMLTNVEGRLRSGNFKQSLGKAQAEVGLTWGEIVEIVEVNEDVGTVTMMDQATESTWQESIAEVEDKIEEIIDNEHDYVYEIVARQYPDLQEDEIQDLLHSSDDIVSGEQQEQEEQVEDVDMDEEPLEAMVKLAALAKVGDIPRELQNTKIEQDVRDAVESGMYGHAADIITDWMVYDTNKLDRLLQEAKRGVTGTTLDVSPETIIQPFLYDELGLERGTPLWNEMVDSLEFTVREHMEEEVRRVREEEERRGGYNRARKSSPVDVVTSSDVSKVDGYEEAYDAVVTQISFDPDIFSEDYFAQHGMPDEREIRAEARSDFNYEYVDRIERIAEQYLETPGEVDRLVGEFETMFVEDAVERVQARAHRQTDHTRGAGYSRSRDLPVSFAREQDVAKYNNPGSGPGSAELTFEYLLDSVGRDVVREYALNYNTQVAARKIMEEFSGRIPEEHRSDVRDMVERQLRAEEERERDPRPQDDSAVPPFRRR